MQLENKLKIGSHKVHIKTFPQILLQASMIDVYHEISLVLNYMNYFVKWSNMSKAFGFIEEEIQDEDVEKSPILV